MSKPDILSRIEKDEDLCVRDGQELLVTGIGDSQEPPRAPEEMDQTKEALGEDEFPEEADTGKLGGCQEGVAVPVSASSGHLPVVSVLGMNCSEGSLTVLAKPPRSTWNLSSKRNGYAWSDESSAENQTEPVRRSWAGVWSGGTHLL